MQIVKGVPVASSRNSNVESLRIVGIVLILLNHSLQIDCLPVAAFPWNSVLNLLSRLGGLGDVIFFGITAYYLANSETKLTLKGQLRRIWLLERQLLVYSIGCYIATLVVWINGLGFNSFDINALVALGLKSLIPLSSNLWWYPTAYTVFIIVLPFLNVLLRRLGTRIHGALAAALFVLCSFSTLPGPFSLGWTPALFVYQYIVFSFVVWYLHPNRNVLFSLILFSMLMGVIGPLTYGVTGSDVSGRDLNMPQSIVPMTLGFSLVLLMVELPARTNRVVNRLASCSFAAFLLLCYPSGLLLVGKVVGAISGLMGELWVARIFFETLYALGVLLIALVIDTLRQAIFSITFDRRRGGLFDSLWSIASTRFPILGIAEKPV